jgi:RNA polymerase sigma-70 factor (ECF subfamily)
MRRRSTRRFGSERKQQEVNMIGQCLRREAEDLVARTQAGDEVAFAQLVRENQGRVYRIALGMLKDPDSAMDVAQETFLRVHRNLARFRSEAAFSTWAYRICVNLSLDVVRRRRPLEPLPPDDDAAWETNLAALPVLNPEQIASSRELGGRILAALEQLPEKHRAILLLREVEGLSYEQLAEVLQIPKGTVMSRLFHARLKLQRGLAALAPRSQ